MSAGMILCYRARLRPAAFGRGRCEELLRDGLSSASIDHGPPAIGRRYAQPLAEGSGLVGLCAALTDDTVCTIDAVAFDEDSGLRISIRGQPGFLPVSRPKWWLDHISL